MALRQGTFVALRAARSAPLGPSGVGRAGTIRSAGSISHGWMPTKYSNDVRAASRVVEVDEPPTAPLSENHDVGEGVCDFSNFVDKHQDTSLSSAAVGLASFVGFLTAVYWGGQATGASTRDLFTRREFPYLDKDFPQGIPPKK
ncbi:hypothetical protein MMPV_007601 [Pyropia vietnamensis]